MLRDLWELIRDNAARIFKSRLFIIGAVFFVMFAILIGRLFQLQILNGEEYYDDYVQITKKEISTKAARGNILDCKGEILAQNRVVYSVTIQNLGVYSDTNGEFNEMILRLVRLLDRFDQQISTPIPMVVNEYDEYEFSGSQSAIRRFIRDVYTLETIESEKEKGNDVYSYSAETVMEKLLPSYGFSDSRWKEWRELTKEEILAICNIRYAMSATSYTRYQSTTICSDISDEVAAAVLEEQSNMRGVNVETDTVRYYPDSEYFSNIIGYVGSADEEELEELKQQDDSYEYGDIIGKAGIEQAYETELQGTKGTDTVYVNNVGLVMETIDSVEPVNGNDIQLTIDKELTVAVYHIIEQNLARIIVEKLVDADFESWDGIQAAQFQIPVKDAYFQMINNNVLDMDHFSAQDASSTEQNIYEKFMARHSEAMAYVEDQLTRSDPSSMESQDDGYQEYFTVAYDLLTDADRGILVTGNIDTSDEVYQNWNDGTISFQEFLRHAIEQGWIDSTKVSSGDEKYSSAETVYDNLVTELKELLADSDEFTKAVYHTLIQDETITGNEICLALFDQGILEMDEEAVVSLSTGDHATAYEFMREKIRDLEITPAQLALDPCSGSAVVVDENTGEIRALVSYPGYDLNQVTNADYYSHLLADQSRPLYNYATQSRTAPGSTYKMISDTAALEEGVVGLNESIYCGGEYERMDHPKCWVYNDPKKLHGWMDPVAALKNSCNIFFYEVGYRLSLDPETGRYDQERGLAKLKQYAELYGFGSKTGLEIEENQPQISNEFPVVSAIGQGTNNFTTVSLARYVTAVATRGTLYEFKLLDKVIDTDGNVLEDPAPVVENQIQLAETTWDVLHEGMYEVVHSGGSAEAAFTDLSIDIAGKSGTAQQDTSRANHALFVSFGPYEEPEIVTAVSLPNAYTSGNAAMVTNDIYQYYIGDMTMDEINEIANGSGGSISLSD